MQKSQKGFTLIELVVVIVLLGILGVTALSRYQNLSVAAATAASAGIASELSAGASINYAAAVTGTAGFTPIVFATHDCNTLRIGGLLASGALPLNHSYTVGGACTVAAGSTYSCSVQDTANPTSLPATATILCTGG